MKKAYFAGGCFWCIVPIFANQNGVIKVYSGYSGGDEINPTYEQVKSQQTGHRESIFIEYDEKIINYEFLLDLFLMNVDPFDPEGQFIDKGHSYTLAIYYQDDSEKALAKQKIKKIQDENNKEVYISLEPFKNFYFAEQYHQDYYKKHPEKFLEELIKSGRKKNSQ